MSHTNKQENTMVSIDVPVDLAQEIMRQYGMVRILDVIPLDYIEIAMRKGNGRLSPEEEKEYEPILGNVSIAELPDEFKDFPMYEFIREGIIRPNAGMSKSRSKLFYDVSNASDEFKKEYSSVITELEVHKILKSSQGKITPRVLGGKIITLMNLTRIYPKLEKSELAKLGSDFVTLINTPKGIKVNVVIRIGSLPNNLYLRIDPSLIDKELLEKISSDTTELIQNSHGLYEEKAPIDQKKMSLE